MFVQQNPWHIAWQLLKAHASYQSYVMLMELAPLEIECCFAG